VNAEMRAAILRSAAAREEPSNHRASTAKPALERESGAQRP